MVINKVNKTFDKISVLDRGKNKEWGFESMITTKEQEERKLFHIHLLNTILLVTFLYTLSNAIASIYGMFPLTENYRIVLFLYSFINLACYIFLKYYKEYFSLIVNIAVLSSVFTFTFMTYSSTYNELRVVWFFFTSTASFMFLGKYYGIFITLLIIASTTFIHLVYGTGLSRYAFMTFITSMMIFAIFIYAFLNKIERDNKTFQAKIIEEIDKRQVQEVLLLRQQRMSNMGEMIDAIAHQWRQPLNQSNMLILDIEDTLKDEEHLSEYVEKQLNKLIKVTSHMSQTIDDFRKLLHENKEKSSFSIDATLQKVFSLMQSNLKDINIEYYKITNDEIVGYENELLQVFIILFSNILDVFKEKNIIDKTLSISIQRQDKDVYINVMDNAGGIDALVLEKVFDPYFTTKKQSGGTGLGLYIAKIMVEQNMQGKLTVSNTYNNGIMGAKFTIHINTMGG